MYTRERVAPEVPRTPRFRVPRPTRFIHQRSHPMTSEELRSRYQVLQRVGREGSVATHLAVAPSQMVVMIHFLGGPEEESRDLIDRIRRLTEPDRARVLDVTQVDGSWIIITKFLTGGLTVREWLDSLPLNQTVTDVVQPALPSVSGAATELSGGLPGDGSSNDTLSAPAQPQKAAADRERHDDVAEVPAEPGEFTRLFQPVDRVNARGTDRVSEPVARRDDVFDRVERQQPRDPPEQPGEFTRLFNVVDKPAAEPVRSTPPPAPAPSHAEPVSRAQPTGVDAAPPLAREVLPHRAPEIFPERAAEPPRAAPAPATQPGEFTDIFQSMGRTQSQPTSESAEHLTGKPGLQQPGLFGSAGFPGTSGTSYLDKLEASPNAQSPHRPANIDPFALPGSERPIPGSPPAPHQAAGPSEYTRVIAGMAAAPPRNAAPLVTPVAPPPPAPARSARPILFGIVLIVVLAVAMVVFFALKTR
jgi:hypothetical protein